MSVLESSSQNPSSTPGLASSQALGIPHILSAVLRQLKSVYIQELDHTLATCNLVNSQWAEEANKLLWGECISEFQLPVLEHLVKIRADRRQIYANYIRTLRICQYSYFTGKDLWIDSLLPESSQLAFPRLEKLTISQFEERTSYKPLSMNQFIQPRLRILRLYVSNQNRFVISQEFLQELQQKSPGLKHISILQDDQSFDPKWNMPPDQAVCFFQAFKSLQSIHWSLDGSMSKASFKALSLCPELSCIDFRSIHESWVGDLTETAFLALQKLRCTGSVRALKLLLPYIKSITHLHLGDVGQSIGIWNFVVRAEFRFLKSLKLCLQSKTVLRGSEILSIAYCSPLLQKLWIGTGERGFALDVLVAENFNDETIKELSKHLPMLIHLSLRCYSETTNLTGNSLISLGRNCPLIRHLGIYARIDWEKLVKDAQPPLWPKLRGLCIKDCPHEEHGEDGSDGSDEQNDTEGLARAIAQYVPAMGPTIVHLGESKRTRMLQSLLERFLRERFKAQATVLPGTTSDSKEVQESIQLS